MGKEKRKRLFDMALSILMIMLCILMIALDSEDIAYTSNPIYNRLLNSSIPLLVGSLAILILVHVLKLKLFGKPEKLLFVLPCLAVAVNNFQFCSFFAGNMHLQKGVDIVSWLFFGGYCLLTALFEELIFRGVVFLLLAERLPNSKKGLFLAVLISSLIFGFSHLLNIFTGANVASTFLQIGYSILTGGMFAFALIKTKNILFSILLHAVYNFGGLLFTTQGLGTGVVFDLPTTLMMAVVAVVVGIFVIIKLLTYSDEERGRLYKKLGIRIKEEKEVEKNPAE